MPVLFAPLLFADADDGEAAPGEAMVGAMRKVAISAATGAVPLNEDAFRAETGIEQLAAIGFDEIEMKAGTKIAVARCARGKKEHGIFFSDRVRVEDLRE